MYLFFSLDTMSEMSSYWQVKSIFKQKKGTLKVGKVVMVLM